MLTGSKGAEEEELRLMKVLGRWRGRVEVVPEDISSKPSSPLESSESTGWADEEDLEGACSSMGVGVPRLRQA